MTWSYDAHVVRGVWRDVTMPMPAERAGTRLKLLRLRLGLTTREVAEISRRIAAAENREDVAFSHARLVQIENGTSTPSVYKLFALSAIYGLSVTELLSFYIDPDAPSRRHLDVPIRTTHLVDTELHDAELRIELPTAFKNNVSADSTNFLCEIAKVWGHVPVAWLKHLNVRRGRYGIIGLSDYTMFPLLRPGSFVQIDETERPRKASTYATEFDRPIFFIETRAGYLCSWCEIRGQRLISIPHPLSPCSTREFAYPHDAQIIGRITAVAARLDHRTPRPLGDVPTTGDSADPAPESPPAG
jgi:transcriptional regulator with XRE-family HTH domain